MKPFFSVCLVIVFSLMGCAVGRIEEPKFDLIERSGDFEIRQYAPTIVAETTVDGDFYDAPNEGFRRLAGYIFGKNKSKDKIAMTAPVSMTDSASQKIAMTAPVSQVSSPTESGANQWLITFTMPGSYTMESLPTPEDSRVRLKQVSGYKAAVLKFSGFNSDDKVKKNTERLQVLMRERNLKPASAPMYARYNPPWTPWFMRRHELIIPIVQ